MSSRGQSQRSPTRGSTRKTISPSSSFMRLISQQAAPPRRSLSPTRQVRTYKSHQIQLQQQQQQYSLKSIVWIIVVLILLTQLYIFNKLIYHQNNTTISTSYNTSLPFKEATKSKSSKKIIQSPFNSHPPDIIELDIGHNIRHACIQQIRKKQIRKLLYNNTIMLNNNNVNNNNKILLVDPAYHSNVGDHMITVAEILFIKQHISNNNNNNNNIQQCSYVQAGEHVPKCNDIINNRINNNTILAIWHGGGNWGDLWRLAQDARIKSFYELLKHGYNIITMPNSWYYDKKSIEMDDIVKIRTNIARGLGIEHHKNGYVDDFDKLTNAAQNRVVFTWREHTSYKKAIRHFPFVTNLLVPDIAFQLGPYSNYNNDENNNEQQKVDILLLLRDDHESIYTNQRHHRAIRHIIQSISNQQYTFSIVDWKDRLQRFHSKDLFFTETSIQLLSLGKIVICDRLHAAILAYLTNLPFIYLDQKTGKITKTLKVAMDSSKKCKEEAKWKRADNLTHAISQAVEMLSSSSQKNGQLLSREEKRERLRKQKKHNPT